MSRRSKTHSTANPSSRKGKLRASDLRSPSSTLRNPLPTPANRNNQLLLAQKRSKKLSSQKSTTFDKSATLSLSLANQRIQLITAGLLFIQLGIAKQLIIVLPAAIIGKEPTVKSQIQSCIQHIQSLLQKQQISQKRCRPKCNQTPLQPYFTVNMRRQWEYNPLSHSSASEPPKIAFSSYSHSSVAPASSRSKQKPVDKRRQEMCLGYQNFAKPSFKHYKSPQNGTLKELSIGQYKQNPVKKELEAATQRLRELQGRFIQYQHRVDSLERSSRNTAKLSTSLEEFMRNQYADLKDRERMQERFATFQQALGHMATIKADRKELQTMRKDLQNMEKGRYPSLNQRLSPLHQRLSQLQSQNGRVDSQILEINSRFQRVVGKIETNFMSMGEKYQEFIESNIIKTIDHVNKLTQHYHTQIEDLSRDYNLLSGRFELLQKAALDQLGRSSNKQDLAPALLGLSLPGLKLVQSLTLKDERKSKGLSNFKQHIKQQHKDVSFGVESSSTTTSENISSNINESLQSQLVNTGMELSFDKVVYKLDREYNLLDENEHYLVDGSGQHIRLNEKHIAMLRQHGSLVDR